MQRRLLQGTESPFESLVLRELQADTDNPWSGKMQRQRMISADRTHAGLGKEKEKLCATIFGKMMHDRQTVKNRNCRHRWLVAPLDRTSTVTRDMMPFFDAEIPRKLDQKPQLVITR